MGLEKKYIYSTNTITSKHSASNKSPLHHVKLKKHHTENMLLHGNVLLLLLLLLAMHLRQGCGAVCRLFPRRLDEVRVFPIIVFIIVVCLLINLFALTIIITGKPE